MSIKIYNTLTGKKEEFISLKEDEVGMYVCGPTVYDVCHIGHARAYIVFDIIKNYLRYRGYKVRYVRNITDVDDKIINRAAESGDDPINLSKRYTVEFHRDMELLGVERADVEPKVTEHIPEIVGLIQEILKKDHAYEVEGDVYFSVRSFQDYGKLSGRNLEEMKPGDVVGEENKKDGLDFALWKAAKTGEPCWPSPWGKGRPGWHIECSVMSTRYLGQPFDIHGGGKDLIFPHHENEIAQSEAARGLRFVQYWVHNGFVQINKEKMSKSLENFFTIKEVLKEYNPEVLRLFLLNKHYRSPLDFSKEGMEEARRTLEQFYHDLACIRERVSDFDEREDIPFMEERADVLGMRMEEVKYGFLKAMDDDFNTARAVACIFEGIRDLNSFINQKGLRVCPAAKGAVEKGIKTIGDLGQILGVFNSEGIVEEKRKRLLEEKGLSLDEIAGMILDRDEARKRRDWDRADRIRDRLRGLGIALEDGRGGTRWRIINNN